MDEAALNETIGAVANALQVAYGLATTLRRELTDAEQHALAMEKAMWTAVGALRRLQSKNGGGK